MPTCLLRSDANPSAAHSSAGLSADGAPLADGPARDALREAMHRLSEAEAERGSDRARAMCQALTEAARALAGLRAFSPAESYLMQAQRWAAAMGGVDLRADLHCALAEVATSAADLAQAEGRRERGRAARERARDHAFEAARLAALTTDPGWEIRLLLRASDVLDRCGDHDDAVQLQQRALVRMGLGNPDLPAADACSVRRGDETSPSTTPHGLM